MDPPWVRNMEMEGTKMQDVVGCASNKVRNRGMNLVSIKVFNSGEVMVHSTRISSQMEFENLYACSCYKKGDTPRQRY